MPRPKTERPRNAFATIRLTATERTEMERQAKLRGFASLSEYVRHLHDQASKTVPAAPAARNNTNARPLKPVIRTTLGRALHGDALDYLFGEAKPESIDLIMTSPPFGLVRKKSYGNEDAHRYCEWFRPFAEGFKRVLKQNGSLVIDIGGAWKPGMPTRSLYHFDLLLMLSKEYGFHLCQEHFWWNPSKLPTPAEWVNVRRVRVKDAINCIWWLSPTPWPRANNRRVLAPYSEAMRSLLKNGYTAKLRPSGHDISDKFQIDNGGSVPPNLLAIANTESNGKYQEFCRERGLPIHPARFPDQLPEYFIRLLTNPGDLVLDPFGGSCVTGAVAERLKRKWVSCELDSDYLEGAKSRFTEYPRLATAPKSVSYSISSPCALEVNEQQVLVIEDGGLKRPALPARPQAEQGKASKTLPNHQALAE